MNTLKGKFITFEGVEGAGKRQERNQAATLEAFPKNLLVLLFRLSAILTKMTFYDKLHRAKYILARFSL